jgi:hypothetical protein
MNAFMDSLNTKLALFIAYSYVKAGRLDLEAFLSYDRLFICIVYE